jgi:hypothetical protein
MSASERGCEKHVTGVSNKSNVGGKETFFDLESADVKKTAEFVFVVRIISFSLKRK